MRGIRKAFGATVALDGVDLSVAEGEICGLIGQNGAGKSTLMSVPLRRAAAGCGRIVDRRPAIRSPQPDRCPPGRRRDDLPGALARAASSVMENILMGAEPMRFGLVDWPRMREMAPRALAELGHDDIPPEAIVGTLSVAAQQLVEIARAIAVGCRVLVLDEPTSSLGRADVEHLFDLLRHLKAQGHAIVYISHFIEEVKSVADRFIVLRDGRNAGGGATAGATHDDIVALMVGRIGRQSVSPHAPHARRGHPRSRLRSSRDRRRSRFIAARSSASPASSAPAARTCCGRCSASSRCEAGASASASTLGAGATRTSDGCTAWVF